MPTSPTSEIPAVLPGIFRMEVPGERGPQLVGGYCPACRRHYFPRPAYCRSCLEPVEEHALGDRGVIHSHTVVRTRAPFGLPEPYSVGYVDLEESGLRVFSLLDPGAIAELRVGLPVSLAVGPLGHDGLGSPRLRPYFTPRRPDPSLEASEGSATGGETGRPPA